MIACRFLYTLFGALAAMSLLTLPTSEAGELHDAVLADDLARLKAAVVAGANVNEPDLNGPALHLAVALGSDDIVKVLIDAGADLESAGEPAGSLPLHVAARSDQARIAELLLARGAKVDAMDGQDRTPLMVAAYNARLEVAKTLLGHGADVMARDGIYGGTALHFAALGGNTDIVLLLLSSGADMNAKSSSNGQTPLFYAVLEGKLDMVKFLAAQGADINATDNRGDTPLKQAGEAAKDLLRSMGAQE